MFPILLLNSDADLHSDLIHTIHFNGMSLIHDFFLLQHELASRLKRYHRGTVNDSGRSGQGHRFAVDDLNCFKNHQCYNFEWDLVCKYFLVSSQP